MSKIKLQANLGLTMAKRLIGYLRAFTHDKASSEMMLEAQLDEIRRYCKSYGYSLIDTVIDFSSGVEEQENKGLNAIIMKSRISFDGVVVSRLDRLTRSADLLKDLSTNIFGGIELHSIKENLQTSTSVGLLMLSMISIISDWECQSYRERTKAALKLRKDQGLLTGKAPLGMRADEDGVLHPDEEERYIVERAKELRRSGLTIKQVASRLGEEGISARSGKAPSWTTVRDWVKGTPRPKRQAPPSLATVSRWVKGIPAPKRQAPPRNPNPKQRSDTQPQSVVDVIKAIRDEGHSIRKTAALLAERSPEIKNSKGNSLAPTQIARLLRAG